MVIQSIASFIFPQKCPFCTGTLVCKSTQGLHFCVKCQTNFIEEVDDEGDNGLEPLYPSSVHQTSGTQRATHFHPLLCQPCNNHQSIIVQLLAAYSDENANDTTDRWEQEYKRYKGELERRYPLCTACRVAVTEKVKQQDFRLRSFANSGRTDKSVRRQVVTNEKRRSHSSLASFCLNLLYVCAAFYLEHKDVKDEKIVVSLSAAFLLMSFVLGFYLLPMLSVLFLNSALLSATIPLLSALPDLNLNIVCIVIVSLNVLNLFMSLFLQKPKMRVIKASREESFLAPLSLKDEDENVPSNPGRNPFYSKTLLSGNTAGVKSMPTSPVYSNKFTLAPSLRPTPLSFKGSSTGLEGDFRESFSLSEDVKLKRKLPTNCPFLIVVECLMRMGSVYIRYLALVNAPLQALIFTAAYALIFNLDSGMHKGIPRGAKHMISLVCTLRLVWLGLDICKPGWSSDLDLKMHFPREYHTFAVDAFVLILFSTK